MDDETFDDLAPRVVEACTELARRFVESHGAPSDAQASYVAAPWNAAVAAATGDPPEEGGSTVTGLLIVLTGSFTPVIGHPMGSPAPTGNCFCVVVDPSDLLLRQWTLSWRNVDLAALGTVRPIEL